MELIIGLMVENMRVNGKIILCMEKVLIIEKMGENMKDYINLIKNMVLVFLLGQMV